MVRTPVRSSQCQVCWGFKWIPPGQGKFHQDILQSGLKIQKSGGGWPGLGVLVVGFSWIEALTPYPPQI